MTNKIRTKTGVLFLFATVANAFAAGMKVQEGIDLAGILFIIGTVCLAFALYLLHIKPESSGEGPVKS